MGFVPGRRPRHGLLSRFSCWPDPRSTANLACRAGPRPTTPSHRQGERARDGEARLPSLRRPWTTRPLRTTTWLDPRRMSDEEAGSAENEAGYAQRRHVEEQQRVAVRRRWPLSMEAAWSGGGIR